MSRSRAPASESRSSAARKAAATASSSPSWTIVVGTPKRNPLTGKGEGEAHTSPPAIAASSSAQQAIEGASGPAESSVPDKGKTPSSGIRPVVVLSPVTPQNAAGIRTEPPVSEPMAAAAMPSATETAAPEDDPPGMRPRGRSHGFFGVPKWGLMPIPE